MAPTAGNIRVTITDGNPEPPEPIAQLVRRAHITGRILELDYLLAEVVPNIQGNPETLRDILERRRAELAAR